MQVVDGHLLGWINHLDLHSAHSQPAVAANKRKPNWPQDCSIFSEYAFSKLRRYNNFKHRKKLQVCEK